MASGFGLGGLGNVFGGLAGGVGDLLNGPRSLGKPERAPSRAEVSEFEAEVSAVRADITRRNLLRRSSTAVSGADFIKRMQQGIPDLDTPLPEPGRGEDPAVRRVREFKEEINDLPMFGDFISERLGL